MFSNKQPTYVPLIEENADHIWERSKHSRMRICVLFQILAVLVLVFLVMAPDAIPWHRQWGIIAFILLASVGYILSQRKNVRTL